MRLNLAADWPALSFLNFYREKLSQQKVMLIQFYKIKQRK